MIVIIAVRRVNVAPKNMAQKTSLQRMGIWVIKSTPFGGGGARLACFKCLFKFVDAPLLQQQILHSRDPNTGVVKY